MFRPSFNPSRVGARSGATSPSTCVAAIGVGVTLALVTSLLPTIARRGGLEPLGLAALAAAPFVANLLGAFAGRFGPRSPGQLARSCAASARPRCSSLFVVPTPPVMVAVAFVFWLSLSFGGPFHLRLWGAMYPARLRGRVVGFLGMGRAAAGAARRARRRGRRRPARRPPAVALAGVVGARAAPSATRACARRSAERPAAVLRPRLHPRPARAAGPRRGSPWPRGSTAAA